MNGLMSLTWRQTCVLLRPKHNGGHPPKAEGEKGWAHHASFGTGNYHYVTYAFLAEIGGAFHPLFFSITTQIWRTPPCPSVTLPVVPGLPQP